VTETDDWRRWARCRSEDPNTMQPEVATVDQLEDAMRVCVGCPVRRECRDLAERYGSAYGVHDGEWFGPLPADPSAGRCEWCQGPVVTDAGHQATARYCRGRCRVAAHRARSKLSA
jgi:hypothetical protein